MQTRTRTLGTALLIVLVAGVGTLIALERRPDPTPLLGRTAATLARVAVLQDRAQPDAVSATEASTIEPGFDLGEVL